MLTEEPVPPNDAAEQLRRVEQRLRLAVEAAGLGIWYANYPFDTIAFSPAICEHLGIPVGTEVSLDTYYTFVHPDHRNQVWAAVARSLNEGLDFDEEYRTVRPSDGRVRWVRAVGRCYYDASGRPHHFDGVTYDVTRRKEKEELLRRTEERLRLAVAAGRLGVWYCDLPLRTIECSRVIKLYLGIPVDADLTVEMYFASIHDDDREQVRRALQRAVREGTNFDVEYRLAPSAARPSWVRAIGRCFLDGRGKPHHFDGIIQDITLQKKEQHERERLVGELSEANRLLERLLGVVGHDLKSPLAAVRLAARFLDEHVRVDEDGQRSIQRILRSTWRMDRLIRQLLDFARIRACGGMPIEIGPVDLHAVCRQVIDEMAGAYPQARVVLEAHGDGTGRWDADRLAQVLSNLVGNAIQHGEGGPITVRVDDAGDDVVVAVHNPGAPIPAELLPWTFDPFRQGQRSGKPSQSVGLGLYIVEQIVRAHGGHVALVSPDRDGTTVTARLPRWPHVPADADTRCH